jgi:maltooligosyltrehalose trehalohydrolase
VHFRVWAPAAKERVEVVVEGGPSLALAAEPEGYHSGELPARDVREPLLYRFRVDGGPLAPDPASRFQPDGPHGPSQVVDPRRFRWSDAGWRGVRLAGAVVYELHVGTFTQEGTFAAAAEKIEALADLGVNVLEVMPVADFPGRFGWGYDGVNLFAPTRLYGTPDDFRAFVDRAHAHGVGVILDVVYNHLGPEGNYLHLFSTDFFTDRHDNEWGSAIDFDGPRSAHVREFFVSNAGYWIDEFHLDGLRLDATQAIHDESAEHVLAAVGRRVREAAKGRSTLVIAENEPAHVRHVRPVDDGGFGLDAVWADDFHHSAVVALTGQNDAYFTDYLGAPQELVSAVKWGPLYQGQYYSWQQARRGTPARGQEPASFVFFLENHDQVANSSGGKRLHQRTSPGRWRATTALLLLAPQTPLLFQGQEFASSKPFLFFADPDAELAKAVGEGRKKFLAQFPSLALAEMQACFADPSDPRTFERSKLDPAERERNVEALALHADLLRLRREDPVFRAQRRGGVDGAVLGPHAFALRFLGRDDDDRLLLVNLGRSFRYSPAPEPLLAPPEGSSWTLRWTSESPRYGGCGGLPPERDREWWIPGEAAVVLAARRDGENAK